MWLIQSSDWIFVLVALINFKFKSPHMAAILDNTAVRQLTNSVLSEIISLQLPYLPSFQNDWNFEAYAIQIVVFKLNPLYKEKVGELPRGIQMMGNGGRGRRVCFGNRVSPAGSGQGQHLCTQGVSEGKLWAWSQLYNSQGIKIIPKAEDFERIQK